MRPPRLPAAGRSHLQPCPRCGETNGITAVACWKCEARLLSEPMPPMREAPGSRKPPSDEVPRVDTEVAAEELHELEAGRARHGPLTLPPFALRAGATANDAHFGSPWASPLFRVLWVAVGLALAAALLAWLAPRVPAERPPASGDAVAAGPTSATPRPIIQQIVSQPGVSLEAAPRPGTEQAVEAARAAPVAASGAEAPLVGAADPPIERTPPAAARTRPVSAPPREAAQTAARERLEAARRVEAAAARRPPPVAAPCTPQVAALGLCTPEAVR